MENEELSQHLLAAKDAQRQLTAEVTSLFLPSLSPITVCSLNTVSFSLIAVFTIQQLQELEEKYSECIEMLHEAQEELKNLRNRNYPAGTPRRYHPLGLYPMVSYCKSVCASLCLWASSSPLKSLYVAGLSGS